jgi:hypothetical protein
MMRCGDEFNLLIELGILLRRGRKRGGEPSEPNSESDSAPEKIHTDRLTQRLASSNPIPRELNTS